MVFLTDGTKQTNDSGLLEVIAVSFVFLHEIGHRYLVFALVFT